MTNEKKKPTYADADKVRDTVVRKLKFRLNPFTRVRVDFTALGADRDEPYVIIFLKKPLTEVQQAKKKLPQEIKGIPIEYKFMGEIKAVSGTDAQRIALPAVEKCREIENALWKDLCAKPHFNIVTMSQIQEDAEGSYLRVSHEPAKRRVMAKLPKERDGVLIKYEETGKGRAQKLDN